MRRAKRGKVLRGGWHALKAGRGYRLQTPAGRDIEISISGHIPGVSPRRYVVREVRRNARAR